MNLFQRLMVKPWALWSRPVPEAYSAAGCRPYSPSQIHQPVTPYLNDVSGIKKLLFAGPRPTRAADDPFLYPILRKTLRRIARGEGAKGIFFAMDSPHQGSPTEPITKKVSHEAFN